MPTRLVLLMQQCWSEEVGQRPSRFDDRHEAGRGDRGDAARTKTEDATVSKSGGLRSTQAKALNEASANEDEATTQASQPNEQPERDERATVV
jgi:hypothetical protein